MPHAQDAALLLRLRRIGNDQAENKPAAAAAHRPIFTCFLRPRDRFRAPPKQQRCLRPVNPELIKA
jgi:hypothetical protein